MKQLTISLPDSQVEKLAEKLTELVTGLGGTVQATNKDLFDTNIPIWERIETVEDAVAYTEIALPDNIDELPLDVQAFLKLRVVCAAYNELKKDELDQYPRFTTNEYRYYPWFLLYTQEEIDRMDEEDRSRVLGRSGSNASALAGVAYSSAHDASSYSGTGAASSHSHAYYGGRLCFKTDELATECGKRFAKLWGQFFAFLDEEVKTF